MTLYPKQRLTAAKAQSAIDAAVAAAMAGYAPPTPPPSNTVSAAPRRLLLTQRSAGFRGLDNPGVSADQTFHDVRTLPGGASGWIRLVFFYDIIGGSCTIDGAIAAQSASIASPINPVDEAGAPAAWGQFTFNNAGLDVSLRDQLQLAYTTAITPVTSRAMIQPPLNASAVGGDFAGYSKQNGNTFSDWLHLPPYRRTDGGAFNLLMTRVKFSGTLSAAVALNSTFDAAAYGRFVRSYLNAGDCVTTPGNFVSTTRATLAAGIGVQYIPQKPSIQVASTGDSTITPALNHIALACFQLSSATLPIEYCSTAKGGLSASDYADQFRALQPSVEPSIMFLEMWSPNAGKNLAEAELGWAKNMQIAADVMRAGGVPVLMAPFPCPGRITTAGEEAVRLSIVARCLSARDAGMRVMDLNALMSAGGSPVATIKPEYSTDGVHPSDDGQDLIAAQATVPMIRSILNI